MKNFDLLAWLRRAEDWRAAAEQRRHAARLGYRLAVTWRNADGTAGRLRTVEGPYTTASAAIDTAGPVVRALEDRACTDIAVGVQVVAEEVGS